MFEGFRRLYFPQDVGKNSCFTLQLILLIAIIMPLSAVAFNRNKIWLDNVILWQDASRKSYSSIRGHNNLGFAYYCKGQLNVSIKEYKAALILSPYNADIRYNIGFAYYKQGRLIEAVKEFNMAASLNPKAADVYYSLGSAYYELGLYYEAETALNYAFRIDPDAADGHNKMANAFRSD